MSRSIKINLGHASAVVGAVALALLAISPAIAETASAPPLARAPMATPRTSPSTPMVDSIVTGTTPALEVRKHAARHEVRPARVRVARHHRDRAPLDVERPALAGVLLVDPQTPPVEEPRPIVPAPAYFVDGIAAAFTIPPPPVVCERRPRDPDLPDPRLYREVPLVCGYDVN